MKKFTFLFFGVVLFGIILSCFPNQSHNNEMLPRFMAWDGEGSFDHDMSNMEIEAYCSKLKENNIDALFLRASTNFYKKAAPIAKKVGLQLHAWRPTMIQSNQDFMEKHQDWYAVSRNNESCIDKPPYVSYYRWFCPNEPKVLEYLMNDYLELAKIDGITGIHFDYIRYCDIFLPVGLLPKYNLVQDHEMAEFDFCYCHRCRAGFKKEFGRDPLEMEDPASDKDWKAWRLKPIVNIVNTITKEVKAQTGKWVTAAVFPTPNMSIDMVRQDWSKFEIDAVFPMLYNGFYQKDVDWIGECVKEGIETMEYKKDLYAGVMVRNIRDPEKFKSAINTALENEAKGVVFFSVPSLTDAHYEILKEYK